MTGQLLERIKHQYEQLSPSHRTVAELLIREPHMLAFGTASDIGRSAGVSESTVIRLAYALGYRGFADMQEQAQEILAPMLMPEFLSRAASEFPGGNGVLGRLLDHDIQLLKHTLDRNRPETFDRAVEMLAGAEPIFVTGARSSYGVAQFFWYTLRMQVGGAVFLEANTPPFLPDLAELGPKSALLAVAFPRYSDSTMAIARYAREHGCPIVAITDDPLGAVGRLADVALTASTESVAATMQFAPVVSLGTALITGIAVQRRQQVDVRLACLEEVQSDWKRISRGS
jgi:DNA-binding MurR/RpiR family transcriptional regulator